MKLIGKESQRAAELARAAEGGDLKAGRELISLCRRGMLIPSWEKPKRITAEVIEKHLARREKVIKTA